MTSELSVYPDNPVPVYGKTSSEITKMFRQGQVTATVVGQGKLGLPLALVIASKGAKVYGLDVNEKLVQELNKGNNPYPFEPGVSELLKQAISQGKFKATTDYRESVASSNFIIFTVPVTASPKGIDLANMKNAITKAARYLRPGSIIITETTLPPGTTESFIPIIEKESGLKIGVDLGLAHAPERTMSGRMIKDITQSYPKVVGALDKASEEAVKAFYEVINSKGVIVVSDIKTAEAVKVFEGVYRDVNIALANELALISQELGINVIEAIRVANTQPYSHIHKPGAGVGGHCIPVYPWFLIHRTSKTARLLRLAREINSDMPSQIAVLTVKALNVARMPVFEARIVVHGIAYRNGVKEHYNSPTFALVKELESWGARVEVEDPLYDSNEIRRLGFTPFNGDYTDTDAIVFVTDHDVYRTLDLDKIKTRMRTPVLIDARYIYLEEKELTKGYYYAAPGIGIRLPSSAEYK